MALSLLLVSLLQYLTSIALAGSGIFSQLAPPDPWARVGDPAPELHLIVHGDKAIKLSDLRGKWVLLQFGTTWLPDSEATALIGSNIRDSLANRPFEFVQVFDEPSVCDAELFNFTQFSGIHAVVDRRRHPSFFSGRRLPAWWLLDPQGVVRAGAGAASPDGLRQSLSRAWKEDPRMNDAPIAATPAQARGEQMLQIYDGSNTQPVVDMAESILRDDPSNELALRFLLHSLIRTKGYSTANKLFAERTSGMKLTDCTRIYMSTCRLTESDRTETRDELLAWCAKYPESRFLRCLSLLTQKLPDELTDEENELLTTAWRQPRAWNIKLYSGFVRQWEGQPAKAEMFFHAEKGRGVIGQLALADHLKRQGRIDEARALLSGRKNLSPDNADPTEAWEQMHANTVLMDWKSGAEYARQYQKLRPQNAQGYLVEWLFARCSGDSKRASELREKSLDLIRASKRYEIVAKLVASHQEPTVRNLTDLADLNVRFDTALLFVMLDWEDKTDPEQALRRAQLAFRPGDWPYDAFNKLRSLEIWKSPPVQAASDSPS